MYTLSKYVNGTNKFSFQTKWSEWENTTDDRQTKKRNKFKIVYLVLIT